jgi:hypothetical protein
MDAVEVVQSVRDQVRHEARDVVAQDRRPQGLEGADGRRIVTRDDLLDRDRCRLNG